MDRHKWADVIIAWANGEEVQIERSPMEWVDYGFSTIAPIFSPVVNYRIKPKTIMIGDMEVPEPLRTPPEDGTEFYCAGLFTDSPSKLVWGNCLHERYWLQIGVVHLDQEAAIAHGKALIKVSGGTV